MDGNKFLKGALRKLGDAAQKPFLQCFDYAFLLKSTHSHTADCKAPKLASNVIRSSIAVPAHYIVPHLEVFNSKGSISASIL
jgi:hypothetical protein